MSATSPSKRLQCRRKRQHCLAVLRSVSMTICKVTIRCLCNVTMRVNNVTNIKVSTIIEGPTWAPSSSESGAKSEERLRDVRVLGSDSVCACTMSAPRSTSHRIALEEAESERWSPDSARGTYAAQACSRLVGAY
eukprot:1883900-Rhodomonas_salina.3